MLNAVAHFHEHVLNSYHHSHIVPDGELIMPLANIFGSAAALTALVVSALTANFVSVAQVLFSQRVYSLILPDRCGQVRIISFIPTLYGRFRLLWAVTLFVFADRRNDFVRIFRVVHPDARKYVGRGIHVIFRNYFFALRVLLLGIPYDGPERLLRSRACWLRGGRSHGRWLLGNCGRKQKHQDGRWSQQVPLERYEY